MNWIEDFKEMLFPLYRDKLNIEKAYQLKENFIPSSIFKYRSVTDSSINNLENDTIWLADPSSFNDPYDCAHTVDFNLVQKYHEKEFMNDILSNGSLDGFLDTNEKGIILNDAEPSSKLIDILYSKDKSNQISGIDITDVKSFLIEFFNNRMTELTKESSRAIASTFKLCSFSERNDSGLMWAHYADYHKGFCIEYDMKSLEYSDSRRRFLYPVIYSDEIFDATEFYKAGPKSQTTNNLHLTLASLMKSKEWSYEREWRLIFSHGVFNKAQPYVMGKPKHIYIGAKTSKAYSDLIKEICNKKNIRCSKMITQHNEFKL